MANEHQYEAARFVWGDNAVDQLGVLFDEVGATRVMVVCGENVGDSEAVLRPVVDSLEDRHVGTYTGARGDTPLKTVERGIEEKKAMEADALLSVGGGSASDTAKAISVLDAEADRDLHELKTRTVDGETYIPELPASKTPLVSVPTTLSAAEVSNIFGVTDEARGEKVVILDETIRPEACVYDPEITATTPPSILASTGMNALNHAVEILYSDGHATNPFYQATAEKAINLLTTHLPAAVNDNDTDAIANVQLAAGLSGFGIVGGISINHGINHALCARHPVSHGDGNSILLPHGIAFNFDVVPERMYRIADTLDVRTDRPDDTVQNRIHDRFQRLQETIGVPRQLRDVGVDRDDFEALASVAVADSAMANNPRPVTEADIVSILEAAW